MESAADVYTVGGLQEVGFVPDSDVLLVVSTAGRGLYDLRSGERLTRDYDDTSAWFDAYHLHCQGIGPLAGQITHTAGMSGGGLALSTAGGWWLTAQGEQRVLLEPFERGQPRRRWPLPEGAGEFRAAGFSPTGRSLIYASSADFTVCLKAS